MLKIGRKCWNVHFGLSLACGTSVFCPMSKEFNGRGRCRLNAPLSKHPFLSSSVAFMDGPRLGRKRIRILLDEKELRDGIGVNSSFLKRAYHFLFLFFRPRLTHTRDRKRFDALFLRSMSRWPSGLMSVGRKAVQLPGVSC